MSIPVTLLPGTVPFDCYPSPQEYNVAVITGARAFVDMQFAGIYINTSMPPADKRDMAWLNPASGRIYLWNSAYGDWMRPYDEPASSKRLLLWEGTLADLEGYGGGSSGAVGPVSGPLWERATEYDGRVVVGVGTLPGSSPAVTVALGATAGSDGGVGSYAHALTVDELPAHHHALQIFDGPVQGGTHPQSYIGTTSQGSFNTDDTGGGQPFNNMPPFKSAYYVRRTARVFVLSPY